VLRNYVIAFILYFAPTNVLAQEELYPELERYSEYRVGEYRSIYQGQQSLWVGAGDSVLKVTGNTVQQYGRKNSPIESRVNDIVEDIEGNVWLSTNKDGVIVFSKFEQQFFQYHHANGLTSNRCDFFTFIGSETFVTCNNGLYSIDHRANKVTHHLSDAGLFQQYFSAFNTISSDENGTLWFVSDDDVLRRYDPIRGSVKEIHTDGVSFKGKVVLFFDSTGRLWVSAEESVYKIEESTEGEYLFSQVEHDITHRRFFTIEEDLKGNVWFGSDKLLIYDEEKDTLRYPASFHPLYDNQQMALNTPILDLEFGKTNELFILNQEGISALPAYRDAISYVAFTGTVGNYINYAYRKSEISSLMNIGSRLLSYDNAESRNVTLKGLAAFIDKDVVLAAKVNDEELVFMDSNVELYLLKWSDSSVQKLDNSRVHPAASIEDIGAILVDQSEGIYLTVVGERPGIYKRKLNGSFINIYPDVKAYSGLVSQSGSVFFTALDIGVLEYSKEGDWTVWPTSNGERVSYSRCMLEMADGVIWVCDSVHGLGYLDKDTRTLHFVESESINNLSDVSGLSLDDNGYLWLLGVNGLIRFDRDRLFSIDFAEEVGIAKAGFGDSRGRIYNLGRGKLLVDSLKYDYVLNTDALNSMLDMRTFRESIVQLVSLKLSTRNSAKVEDKSLLLHRFVDKQEPFVASYNDFLFSFRFAVNDFIERSNFQFEYRLLGLNDNWLLAEQDSASYSTLPAGEYILEVRAVDSRSIVKQPITRLPIKVLPPYWLTTQAYIFYIFFLLLSFYLIYRFRTRQLTQANIRLEKSVIERTRELTESTVELSNSNKQISDLLTQKESLFANVSHEFRTPLTLILGPMSELRSQLTDERDVYKFDIMHRNTKRLVQLVEQILELARLDTAVESPKQIYDIDSTLGVLVNSFKPLAELKEQKLILSNHCSGGLELTKDALEKILYNLLSNAIKYSPEGGTITVTGEQVDNLYQLRVQDTGLGIPEEELENIFERFTRLEKTAGQLGSGLGLAVVKELVNANDGIIDVSSELNHGATFTVTFPLLLNFDANQVSPLSDMFTLLDSELVTKAPSIPKVIDTQLSETNTKPVLLIIEDNADMRVYIRQSLEGNYQCIIANNGQQGIEMAVAHVPDIVLSDLMMPLKGGFEVVDALRSNELTAHIPITLLTAKGDDVSRLTGWQKTVDDYIAKPFNIEELQLRLARLLSVRDIVKRRVTQQVSQGVIMSNIAPSNFGKLESIEEDEAPLSFSSKRDEQFYNKLMQVIEDNYADSEFGRQQAADKLAVSERQLNRKLGAIIEYNFADLVRKYRLGKAKILLMEGYQIGEVAFDVGFTSPSYFSRCFKAEFDYSPKEFLVTLKL
jgi:signal transduction histidine kinase/AraC-like DNA-binding protein/FixJ family two-component response regulator/streptogramin lyase